jgi:hypothetical protein
VETRWASSALLSACQHLRLNTSKNDVINVLKWLANDSVAYALGVVNRMVLSLTTLIRQLSWRMCLKLPI